MDTGTGTSPSPLDLLGPLDSTLGAAFIGVVIAGTFFGITLFRSFSIILDCPTRWKRIQRAGQFTIYFLWAMDTLHLALITRLLFYMVTNYFNPVELLRPTWSFMAQVFVSNISEILIQLPGYGRSYDDNGLHDNTQQDLAVIVCTMIIILSLISFSCGFAFAIQSLTAANLDFSNADRTLSVTLYVSFGGEVLADISIASTLCTVLYKSRTSFSSTKNVINSLIVYAINTCVLTTCVPRM
ncbi:hypothetical protein BDZ89DRAFT_1169227 [Hymenopellis radicata]|nr:hypothetical protein BDZ89DRAFT_1169227 [Hymenopellis radicata]